MLSHQGRNIFWASEWAIIFPMRALPSIAILEVFYQAGQGKARQGKAEMSTKMFLTTEVSAGTEAQAGPRTDWWSEKESLENILSIIHHGLL